MQINIWHLTVFPVILNTKSQKWNTKNGHSSKNLNKSNLNAVIGIRFVRASRNNSVNTKWFKTSYSGAFGPAEYEYCRWKNWTPKYLVPRVNRNLRRLLEISFAAAENEHHVTIEPQVPRSIGYLDPFCRDVRVQRP